MRICKIVSAALALCSIVPCGHGATGVAAPRTIGFTSLLSRTGGASVSDGTYAVSLSLYASATGGTPLWTETKTVHVTHGLFSTSLGDTVPLPTAPTLDFSNALFVGVSAGPDSAHLDVEMQPRVALQGVPYAMFAQAVADNTVTAPKLVSDSNALNKVSGGTVSAVNGLIGIGTSSPIAQLDVRGNLSVSGNAAIGGNLAVAGSISAAALRLNGTSTTGGVLTVDGQGNVTPQQSSPYSDRRHLLLESTNPVLDSTCYLYRSYSTTGDNADEYTVMVPFMDGQYACYTFKNFLGNGVMNLGRWRMGVVCINSPYTALTKTGTWSTYTYPSIWRGSLAYSQTSGDTISGTVTGHTLLLRLADLSDAGYAEVAIDGDYTKATLLPAFTAADVASGVCTTADVGKRYVNTFSMYSPLWDQQWPLVQGLPDITHTITVRVMGTAPAGSNGKAVYITGFMAATAGLKPTDTNASMGYYNTITDRLAGNTFEPVGNVIEFTPDGLAAQNPQFLGEAHATGGASATEQQSSGVWRREDGTVIDDGQSVRLANDAYASSHEIMLDRITDNFHPSTPTVAAMTDRARYSFRGDRPMQLRHTFTLTWKQAGTVLRDYIGQFPIGRRQYGAVHYATTFTSMLLGDTTLPLSGHAMDGSYSTGVKTDFAAAYSTQNDAVAVEYWPRQDLNVNNWTLSAPYYTAVVYRTDGTYKAYNHRSWSLSTEKVSPGTVFQGENDYRATLIPNAAKVLGG